MLWPGPYRLIRLIARYLYNTSSSPPRQNHQFIPRLPRSTISTVHYLMIISPYLRLISISTKVPYQITLSSKISPASTSTNSTILVRRLKALGIIYSLPGLQRISSQNWRRNYAIRISLTFKRIVNVVITINNYFIRSRIDE